MKYTKEQKQEYFSNLRKQWKETKEQAENDEDGKAKYEALIKNSPNHEISYTSFYFVLSAMIRLGLSGSPYIDTKTYKGWLEAGFQVKKGEKSVIDGITWIKAVKDEDEDDDGMIYPKVYNLFHRSQVEEI